MRAFFLLVVSSLLALAAAQTKPNPFTMDSSFMITAGQPTQVTWKPTTGGTVTIHLREGASSNLDAGTVVASHIANNGRATITVDSNTVRNSDYTLSIVSDSDPNDVNYSAPFVVESKNTVVSASSPGSSATVSSNSAGTKTGSPSKTNSTGSNTVSTEASQSNPAATATTSGSSSLRSSSPSGSSATTGAPAAAPSSGATSLIVQSGLLVVVLGAAVAL